MTTDEKLHRSESERTIERGGMYHHATHGPVKVTDIWNGTKQVDTPPPPDEREPHAMIVVRYVPVGDDDWRGELADTRDEFRDAID